MNVYINDSGHVTKMASRAINSKRFEIFYSSSPKPEAYEFKTWHKGSMNGAINNDLWMTLADFWQGQLRSPMHLKGANVISSLQKWENG